MNTKKLEPSSRKYAAPAIDAMLDILEYLSAENRACGVSEMSRALGISTNLAFRIMKRLVERGYAECDSASCYRLSTRFFSLGMKLYSQFELRRRARPQLEILCSAAQTTCQMQVLEDDRMLVAEVITPNAPFFLQVVPGTRLEPYCDAFGKAVMAFLPTEQVDAILPKKLQRFTPNTLGTRAALEKEFAAIRERGIAYDNEEYNIGIFCIGSPVFDLNGNPVGGVGLTGLSTLFPPEQRQPKEQLVLAAARNISRSLGYEGKFFET